MGPVTKGVAPETLHKELQAQQDRVVQSMEHRNERLCSYVSQVPFTLLLCGPDNIQHMKKMEVRNEFKETVHLFICFQDFCP